MSKCLTELYGYFENPLGYSLVKVADEARRFLWVLPLPSKAIYEVRLHKDHPLTFVRPNGVRIQFDRHTAKTDMGSVPPALQIFFHKDRFLKGYLFHDSGYLNHGLYFLFPGKDEYEFVEMERSEVDALLRTIIGASGGNKTEMNMIWAGVRAGGGKGWNEGSAPMKLPVDRSLLRG